MRIPEKPAPVVAAIQRELRDMDPNVPLLASAKLEDTVGGRLKSERMTAYSCGCFGALGAGAGRGRIVRGDGVCGGAANQGGRDTDGAGAGRLGILGMMVGEALVPVLAGIAVGIAGGLAATGVVASLLFGVAPGDPLSFVFAVWAMLGWRCWQRRFPRAEPAASSRWSPCGMNKETGGKTRRRYMARLPTLHD